MPASKAYEQMLRDQFRGLAVEAMFDGLVEFIESAQLPDLPPTLRRFSELGEATQRGITSSCDALVTSLVRLATLPAPAPESVAPTVVDHEFEAFDGATGRACTKLVEDADGYGTDCGLPPAAHPSGKSLAP